MNPQLLVMYSTCDHLELRPSECDIGIMKALMWEITEKEDNTPAEKIEYVEQLIGPLDLFNCRHIIAWCKKLDQCCVLTESVVISEETPLTILLTNVDRLERCDTRECGKPRFPLCEWVPRHLNLKRVER